MTTATWIVGGTTQTGAITLGRSTGAQTLNIATGATTASTTKAINIGTAGVSTSVTNITSGSSVAGALVTHTWNAGANNMTLDSSGNVGIGTTSPGELLHISKASGDPAFRNQSSAGNIYVVNRAATSAMDLLNAMNGPMTFGTNNSERMRIDSSGIVTMNAYGAGAATFSAAGVISSVSDETWKIKDGVPVDPDSMLNKLEPGYWYYNDEKKETFGTDRQLGFYAQNVNAAIGPEAAPIPEKYKDKDGNDTDVSKPWGYYDRSVLAVTVMSLQKALAAIESLTARIAALEAK
jgi:hypothetical protein